jgi:hypothetical protein
MSLSLSCVATVPPRTVSFGLFRIMSALFLAGTTVCGQPNVINSTFLQCNVPPQRVGAFPVKVMLNDQNSTSRATLHRLCGEGSFGLPGDECGDCPEVLSSVAQRVKSIKGVKSVVLCAAVKFWRLCCCSRGANRRHCAVVACCRCSVLTTERGVHIAVPSAACPPGLLQSVPCPVQQLRASGSVPRCRRRCCVSAVPGTAAGR